MNVFKNRIKLLCIYKQQNVIYKRPYLILYIHEITYIYMYIDIYVIAPVGDSRSWSAMGNLVSSRHARQRQK
jgi:hypothetical protein